MPESSQMNFFFFERSDEEEFRGFVIRIYIYIQNKATGLLPKTDATKSYTLDL